MKLSTLSAFGIILGVWAVLYLPFLGSRELQGNEARRILPAISMLESGNWITPELANEPYYKKPPLINWMIAASFKIFGNRTELSARLVSSLMTLFFAIFAILMPSGWLDMKSKIATATIFLTTYGVIIHGRLAEIEASLASLTGIATLWWLNAFSSKNKSEWALWLVPGIVLGLGLLLKGPIILMFFYATVFSTLAYSKKLKNFLSIPHLVAVIIMLGVFLLWALKMKSLIPHEAGTAVTRTWKAELLDEINPASIEYGKWLESVIVALSFFLPWGIAIYFLWRKKTANENADKGESLTIAKAAGFSLLISFLLTNIMPGTEARYSVPMLPLASALAAFAICRENDAKIVCLCRKMIITLTWLLLPLSILLQIAASTNILSSLLTVKESLKSKILFPFVPANITVAMPLLIAGIVLSIVLTLNRKKINSGFGIVLGGSVVAILAMQLIYFAYIPLENSFAAKKRFFANEVNKAMPYGKTLHVLDVGYQPYLYYFRDPKKCIYSLESIDARTEFLIMGSKTYTDLLDTVKKRPELLSNREIREILHAKYKRVNYVVIQLREKGR